MKKSRYSRKYRQLLTALRATRKAADLTQTEVARRLGTHASYVSKCETGERRIDVVELAEFCRIYRIPLAEFLNKADLK